jgi:hypothetical protein
VSKSFKHLLIKPYEEFPLEELLYASPAVLQGVSNSDAQKMMEAFRVFQLNRWRRINIMDMPMHFCLLMAIRTAIQASHSIGKKFFICSD